MAIIYTYGFDDNVQDNDAWVGTNSGNRKTKQFSALSVANYMNRYARVSIGGQMSYKLTSSSPGLGEMTVVGGGDGTNFVDIEFLNISTSDLSGAQVTEFLDYLVSTGLLISHQNNPSTFGHYTVVAYTPTVDPSVYKLELGILGGNGKVFLNNYYDLSPLNLAGGTGSGVTTVDTSEGSFITLTPTTPTAGNVLITADLSATGTPDATTFLRGDNTWAVAGEVDGSGTTNYVSKWQDPTTLTDSVIYDNGVRVGIGTTSPSVKLDVQGTVLVNNEIRFVDSSMRIFRSSNDMRLRTGNSDRMTINSLGNVGIGTTSPVSNLHVSGGGGVSTPVLFTLGSNDDGAGTNSAEIRLLDNGTTKWQVGKTSLNDFWVYDNTAGRSVITAQDNGNLLLMQTSGNVGIGTSSPQEKLDISAGNIRLDDNREITWATTDANVGRVRITGSEAADIITFVTDNSERMRLTNTGLGIGTTSPAFKTTIYSNSTTDSFPLVVGQPNAGNEFVGIGLSGFVASNGAVKAAFVLDRTNTYGVGDIHFLNNTALDNSSATLADSRLTIKENGNVGIGTTSPSQKLHVSGNARLTGAFYDSNNSAGAVGQVLTSTSTSTEWTDPGSITQVPVPITAFAGGSLALAATVNFVYFSWLGGSGIYTLNLPSAVTYPYKVIRFVTDGGTSASNKIHIQGSGGQTVDGGVFYTLDKAYNGVQVWSDGSEWIVIQAKAT